VLPFTLFTNTLDSGKKHSNSKATEPINTTLIKNKNLINLWPLHIVSVLLHVPYLKPKLVPSSDPAQHDQTQLEGNGEPSCVENEKNNHIHY